MSPVIIERHVPVLAAISASVYTSILRLFIRGVEFSQMTNNTMDFEEKQKMFRRSCFIAQLVALSVRVAERAGNIIKEWTFNGTSKPYYKGPVSLRDLYTDADIAAEDCIISSLYKHFGDSLKIIGEEQSSILLMGRRLLKEPKYDDKYFDNLCEPLLTLQNVMPTGTSVIDDFDSNVLVYDGECSDEIHKITSDDVVIWVDPLDGTYELVAAESNISGEQEVTVLILSCSWSAGSHRTNWCIISRATSSWNYTPTFWGTNAIGRTIWAIKGIGVHGIETVLKCLEGAAAYVFASPGCKKWDTCAPEAIITASGGKLTDISGNDLYYGADTQIPNSGGVLATAHWVNHQFEGENALSTYELCNLSLLPVVAATFFCFIPTLLYCPLQTTVKLTTVSNLEGLPS
ncbi:3'(2'),5'-bisphosphate nucleotidase 1 [Dirofilaria immitis]|nr:3'(2'),5'-bisphosphate nucleotidase 1 [Dirofilaria immitis]